MFMFDEENVLVWMTQVTCSTWCLSKITAHLSSTTNSPSSLSLYWSSAECVFPFWFPSALMVTASGMVVSGSGRVFSSGGCSRSCWSFFSYSWRVDAEIQNQAYENTTQTFTNRTLWKTVILTNNWSCMDSILLKLNLQLFISQTRNVVLLSPNSVCLSCSFLKVKEIYMHKLFLFFFTFICTYNNFQELLFV